MSDPRLTPANDRVAHSGLKGQVTAARYTNGTLAQVATPTLPILSAPGGPRIRELILGARFTVLEELDGHAFGFAEADGYTGWVPCDGLAEPHAPTHKVTAIRSYWQESPDLKQGRHIALLPFGAKVHVTETRGDWTRATLQTEDAWIPTAHLGPLDTKTDPVTTAERFLGTPYLWGGNSSLGLDCSGLVQAALTAAGQSCPGDSDMQMSLGRAAERAPQRGDLLFWKGHVAMVVDATRMIHANAHHMAVAYEDIAEAKARIAASGGGELIAHRRL